jgi:hypothetical protein
MKQAISILGKFLKRRISIYFRLRDIVYDLLGLVTFSGKSIEIIPDYSKPIIAVYTELAKGAIEDRQTLSTICVPTSHISSFSEGRTPFS